jgi:hypothetical protein
LQKRLQDSFIALDTISAVKESAMASFASMINVPKPGGFEEAFLNELMETEGKYYWRGIQLYEKCRRTQDGHGLVTSIRSHAAIRQEVITTIQSFVDERLVIEPFIIQLEVVFGMKVRLCI